MNVRVRFAPSPTGHLHVGSMRVALFNWLFARHHGGMFLLRIEDTDQARSTQEYTDSILKALAWVGMTSDEPVVLQTNNIARHHMLIEQLLREGKAYKCYCSPEDLEKRLLPGQFGKKYDKYCRTCAEQAPDKPHVVRFKIPETRSEITFHDLVLGDITVDSDQLDDFIIARSDGMPIYNFVVVADDIAMRITHVIRGQDHISNTSKQLLLYQALGHAAPAFAHLPMILGKSGKLLSKRDAATAVFDYKDMGVLPEALLNYLARLSWAHGNQEIFTVQELVADFSLEHVGKSSAIFDVEKLWWINGEHIKRSTPQYLHEVIVRDIDPTLDATLSGCSKEQIFQAIALYQPRAHTLVMLRDELYTLLRQPVYDPAVLQTITPDVTACLKEIVKRLSALEWSAQVLETTIKQATKDHGLSLGPVAHALRIAITGKPAGAGVFAMLMILGQQESVRRIGQLF